MNALFLTAAPISDYQDSMNTLGDSMALVGILLLFCFAILAISWVATWRIYEKAGYAGWKCLIPFYNSYVLCQIAFGADKGWYFVFGFIPLVSYVFPFVQEFKLCQVFGKGIGFTILAFFFTPITRLVLAFGDSEYIYKPRF